MLQSPVLRHRVLCMCGLTTVCRGLTGDDRKLAEECVRGLPRNLHGRNEDEGKQGRKFSMNVTLRSVRVTIVAFEEQTVLFILSVCL
jgi:hypothetical protein